MVKYRLYNNGLFLYEGNCSEVNFKNIKRKYDFGNYKIAILK